ncbi:MAG: hypothetical protein ACP5EP_12755, partial [Acidobacteriaceae bacterium]
MTQSNASNPETVKEAKLPRRDWILLPMLSLLTICLIVVSTELIARRMFHESGNLESCLISDPSTGVHGIPNTICWEKPIEGQQQVEYRFNGCGHRTDEECGLKPPGTYRIVMIGTSIAMG